MVYKKNKVYVRSTYRYFTKKERRHINVGPEPGGEPPIIIPLLQPTENLPELMMGEMNK